MNRIRHELRQTPLLWLLVFVPIVLVISRANPKAHTLLFFLSVAAVVPLAALLSKATESVAAKTGDMIGGLLNSTLGNLTEMVIAITALRQGMIPLVKASIAGAVVTNSLFMLGASFLLGGLKHHTQEFNRINARMHTGMLFLATIVLLIPSAIGRLDHPEAAAFTQKLSAPLSVLLILIYALSLLFSLKTHSDLFIAAAGAGHDQEAVWPMPVALGALAGTTLLVALVSEIFVESVQEAALDMGMTAAFVGFIVVSLVGAAAEMATAFSAARKNRLDMSVGIAMGSSTQIALFVAPMMVLLSYAVAPSPMDLGFTGGHVLMVLLSVLTVSLVVAGGRSAWFSGLQLLSVYLVFAITLYLLPGPPPVENQNPTPIEKTSVGSSQPTLKR